MSPTLALAAALAAPWNVGPAPSAHRVEPGVGIAASATGFAGPGGGVTGGSVEASAQVGTHLWVALAAQPGAGWTTCPDCRSMAGTATVRGVVYSTDWLTVSPWMVTTATRGALEWTPGLAAEAGTERLRVDTSWPVFSTLDLRTTLRITPEAGVSWRWSDHHQTRLALVGLEPAVAVQHRIRTTETWSLESTLRRGEEGTGLLIGLRWRPKTSLSQR